MNHAGRIGNPKPIEVFAQLLHFIAARNAVILEIRRSSLGVVRFQLEPDVGVADVWDPINPELDGSELENAAFRFLLEQRQTERVAIKGNCLLIGVIGALDRNICPPREIRTVDVGDHEKS